MLSSKQYSINNIRNHIIGINKKVTLRNGSKVKYINFDNAASTPALSPVFKKVEEFLEWSSSIHRGTGYKSKISTLVYDQCHEIVLNFLNADTSKNTAIFVKNATEGINKLSYRLNLKKDDIVIATLMEHHSNDLPWRDKAKVLHTNILNNGALDLSDLEYKLKANRNKVRLVALTGCSNVTGIVNDIYTAASLCHKYGSQILVDGAQLVPHRKVSMSGINDDDYIDFMVFSAHKMYAPFGTGVLVGPKATFMKGNPEYIGGGTITSVTQFNAQWADPPEKDEAGTPNVVGAVALAEAIRVLEEIDMECIKNHESELTHYLYKRLSDIPNVKTYSPVNDPGCQDMVGVITFEVDNIPHNLLASVLSYDGGIGVRSGCFCAHPYIHRLLNLSPHDISELQKDLLIGNHRNLPGLVRVSFGLYNNLKEINSFVDFLENIVMNKEQIVKEYTYDKATGEYKPVNLSRKLFCDFTL